MYSCISYSSMQNESFLCNVMCRLYHIFPHYLTNVKIFGKMLLNIKWVFPPQRLFEKSHAKNWDNIHVHSLHVSTRYFCHVLIKLEFSRWIFLK